MRNAPRAFVLSLRDVLHFLVAFAAAFIPLWQASGSPVTRVGLYALIPAAATVLFRQCFPNAGRVDAVVTKAVAVPVVDPTTPSLF